MKDIDQIRRDNLKLLEIEAGSPTSAAKLANMSLSQFANLRDGAKDSKTGKARGMRKSTARLIEEHAAKPQGWLDIDHSVETQRISAPAPRQGDLPWPFKSIPEEQVRALPPSDLKALEGAIAAAISMLKLKVQPSPDQPTARGGLADVGTLEEQFPSGDPLSRVPATSYAEYAALPSRNPKAAANGTILVNVAPGEPHAANEKFDKVPELGNVLLAAGEGIENENEVETGFVQFRRSFLQSVGASAKKARVVYAKGDSMEPVIQDGAALLVVPNDDLKIADLTTGGVYAINYDGKMIVKTVVRDRLTGKLAARSFNPMHHDVPLEDGMPVRVLGRVVWAGSPLRDDHAGQWVRR